MTVSRVGCDSTTLVQYFTVVTLTSFNLAHLGLQGEVYKGTRFFNGDRALVVNQWLHCVDEDASGLTFEKWNQAQDVDTSQESQ